MTYEDPTPQEEPTSRLAGRMPWIILGIGTLAILAVLGAIMAMRRGGEQVNGSVAGQATRTAAVVGVPVTVVVTTPPPPSTPPPPTLIIPTPTPPTPVIATAVPRELTPAIAAPPPVGPPSGANGQIGAQPNPTAALPPTLAPQILI